MLWAMRPRMAFVADDQVLHVVSLKPDLGMRLRLAIVTDDYALHVVNLRPALGHSTVWRRRSVSTTAIPDQGPDAPHQSKGGTNSRGVGTEPGEDAPHHSRRGEIPRHHRRAPHHSRAALSLRRIVGSCAAA